MLGKHSPMGLHPQLCREGLSRKVTPLVYVLWLLDGKGQQG